MAAFVELFLNDDKRFGAAREPLSFHLFCWQHLSEEVVEVRHSLISRRVELCCWVGVNLHNQTLTDFHCSEVPQGRWRAGS